MTRAILLLLGCFFAAAPAWAAGGERYCYSIFDGWMPCAELHKPVSSLTSDDRRIVIYGQDDNGELIWKGTDYIGSDNYVLQPDQSGPVCSRSGESWKPCDLWEMFGEVGSGECVIDFKGHPTRYSGPCDILIDDDLANAKPETKSVIVDPVTIDRTPQDPIAWCDADGARWAEQGTVCHLDPAERKAAMCNGEGISCRIPEGFSFASLRPPWEWPRQSMNIIGGPEFRSQDKLLDLVNPWPLWEARRPAQDCNMPKDSWVLSIDGTSITHGASSCYADEAACDDVSEWIKFAFRVDHSDWLHTVECVLQPAKTAETKP